MPLVGLPIALLVASGVWCALHWKKTRYLSKRLRERLHWSARLRQEWYEPSTGQSLEQVLEELHIR